MRPWQEALVGAGCMLGVSVSAMAFSSRIDARVEAPPGTCPNAIGRPCDEVLETAFTRWGPSLAQLGGADLGIHEADPVTTVNYAALQACSLVSSGFGAGTEGSTEGEASWFALMAGDFPDVDLGAHHELFDAAMELVCPKLGYIRGYDYTGNSGEEPNVTESLPDAPPGTPGWRFVDCAGALEVLSCTAEEAALYQRWGERLPYLYYDPEGTYGAGPWLGEYQNASITYAQFNRSALTLCQLMDTAIDVDAAANWFHAQSTQFPNLSPASHMLFFHATLTLVCPDVSLPTESS